MRFMQHKKEAYWFYRFLSIFYDNYVNPLFWTEEMRDRSLELARLDHPRLTVIDVGSGTGFTTQGIVRKVDAEGVTCIDQSPHQMAKARRKEDLERCTFLIGDAENIPFEADRFDRYISAGSIEYWPDPQTGIDEAYRVIRPGGVALMIGPLEPGSGLPRFLANIWMLFPKEQEYRQWFEQAGFTEIETRYIRPHWHISRSEYGIAISGVKPRPGPPPNRRSLTGGMDSKEDKMTTGRRLQMAARVVIGSMAGFFFIPIALLGYLRSRLTGNRAGSLNRHQMAALILFAVLVLLAIWLIATTSPFSK